MFISFGRLKPNFSGLPNISDSTFSDKSAMTIDIEKGLRHLTKTGVDLVFVLGHPEYYPRYGFKPAGHLGFEAPYPIPDEHADAWMVQALRPGVIGSVSGKVRCADELNMPEHWRE
jgi:putative acetyltransferase